MTESVGDIRGVMIPISNGRVLLPNATVAEVITYSLTENIPDSPAWLLGRISWRGWRLPIVSFSLLTGLATEEGFSNVRVTVLKALGGNPKMPFFAMLAQGFPRLTTINPSVIAPLDQEQNALPCVYSQVMVRDDRAFIPDLMQIEALVTQVLAI